MHKPRAIRKERPVEQVELLGNLLKCFMDYLSHTYETEDEMVEAAHGFLDPLFKDTVIEDATDAFNLFNTSIVPSGFPQMRKDCFSSTVHKKKE
jgi:hypothetical protein